MNKVNKLLRDGLKLRNVKVTCECKLSKGHKLGVIVASIENTAKKQEIMRVKANMKNTTDYKREYIGNYHSLAARVKKLNMFAVLKELGKANEYFVSSNGRILKKTGNAENCR